MKFSENQTNGCLNTLVYYDDHSYYSDQKIFEMEWKQQNFQDYLSITLIYKENGIFSVYMKSFNNIGREINYSELKPVSMNCINFYIFYIIICNLQKSYSILKLKCINHRSIKNIYLKKTLSRYEHNKSQLYL